MEFAFTDDQEQLRQAVRRFLDQYAPESEVRRLVDSKTSYDPAVWARMASELGLQGLIIPEEYGGSGASWMELGIVLEEMGRALLCSPFFATVVLAASALLECGDGVTNAKLLPGIADGSIIATLALLEESGRWDESGIELRAVGDGPRYRLTGRKKYVVDGLIADFVIVPARTDAGVTLFVVDGSASNLTKTALPAFDLTRQLADLDFAGTDAAILGEEGRGWPVMKSVLSLAAIGLAAEQAGGAEAALAMAVEYAKLRIQFGQPIGMFQAIKHKCADVLVEVESAKSVAYRALRSAADRDEEFEAVASLAKAFCSDAFVWAAHENMQIHGGIAYTWELPAHLYFKRAKSSEIYFGDPIYHRERLAQQIGL
jgi:alkylation response protein AidB-like acyl-CoA dehydrogenase